MAVSKRTRFEVLRRDNHTCRYCRSTDNPLTIDHVTPVALGGTDKPDNLVACCRDCNAGKSSSSPDEAIVAQVADDAVRWAAAIKQAAEQRRKDRAPGTRYVKAVDKAWRAWHSPVGEVPRPADWRDTLRQFHDLGLPLDEMLNSVELAMGRTGLAPEAIWRYCCGIAWNKVRDLQTAAADIIQRDGAR